MLRELTYSAGRMGFYEPIKHQLGATDRHHTPLHIKLAAGALAGNTANRRNMPMTNLTSNQRCIHINLRFCSKNSVQIVGSIDLT